MTDDRDNQEPLSSEELIRRARDGMSSDAEPPTEPVPDVEPEVGTDAGNEFDAAADSDLEPETDTFDAPEPQAGEEADASWVENAPHSRPDLEAFPDLGSDVKSAPPADEPPPPPDAPWPDPDLPGSSGPLPAPPRSGASRLFATGRWIVGGILLFLFLGQCVGSGTTLDDLDVGDCFENPGVGDEVSEVDTVDCAEPHDFELYARVTLGTSNDDVFPGSERLFAELEGECVALFPSYVGHDYLTSVYDFVAFTPVERGWRDGDRTGMCALYEFDGAFNVIETSGTARNSGR